MPADPRTADQILKDVGHDYHDEDHGLYSVRRTLMRSWRDTTANGNGNEKEK